MIELVVVGATFAAAAWAAGTKVLRRASAASTLERYARSREIVFIPAPAGRHHDSPRARGVTDDGAYEIDLYRLGGSLRTRVGSVVDRGLLPALSIAQRETSAAELPTPDALGEGARPDRSASAPKGSGALHEAYLLREASPLEDDLLREITRPLLLLGRARRAVWLRSNAARVTLSWSGVEENPVLLDVAREVVLSVARRRRPTAPYR